MEVQPKDPSKKHFHVSIVKSIVRICAGLALINGAVTAAGIILIAAEVLGVVEEMV